MKKLTTFLSTALVALSLAPLSGGILEASLGQGVDTVHAITTNGATTTVLKAGKTANTITENNKGLNFPLTVETSQPVAVYSYDGTTRTKTGRMLAKGTSWKVFSADAGEGNTWYNLGGNQWVIAIEVGNVSNSPLVNSRLPFKKTTTVTSFEGINLFKVVNRQITFTDRLLPNGSTWKTFGSVLTDEGVFYDIGIGWVQGGSAVVNSDGPAKYPILTMTVHYVKGYGIRVWAKNGDSFKALNKVLPSGSRWKTFGSTSGMGTVLYNVGGNQWVDSKYFY